MLWRFTGIALNSHCKIANEFNILGTDTSATTVLYNTGFVYVSCAILVLCKSRRAKFKPRLK